MRQRIGTVMPLCGRAVEILERRAPPRRRLDRSSGVRLLFPIQRGKAIRDATLSALIGPLGIRAVPPAFRSSFRDGRQSRPTTRAKLSRRRSDTWFGTKPRQPLPGPPCSKDAVA